MWAHAYVRTCNPSHSHRRSVMLRQERWFRSIMCKLARSLDSLLKYAVNSQNNKRKRARERWRAGRKGKRTRSQEGTEAGGREEAHALPPSEVNVSVLFLELRTCSKELYMIPLSPSPTSCFSEDHSSSWSSLIAQSVKNLPAMQDTRVWFLDQEDSLEKEMATHSSILA